MDILQLFQAFVLGVVEGVTEFLPISSTGHLIIVGNLFDFNDARGKVFEIFIQLGAILAVCWEYRARIACTLGNVSAPPAQRMLINLALACLPAALLGAIFHVQIKAYLFNPVTVAVALIVGGIIILLIERYPREPDTPTVDDMDWKHALKIGFAQCFSLIPGISRAGATIMGGMVFGLSRKAATEFSFFLAIPIIFAATSFDLFQSWDILHANDLAVFAVGFVTAFISALLVVRGLLRFVAHHNFCVFAWYRIVFGLLVLGYFWQ